MKKLSVTIRALDTCLKHNSQEERLDGDSSAEEDEAFDFAELVIGEVKKFSIVLVMST